VIPSLDVLFRVLRLCRTMPWDRIRVFFASHEKIRLSSRPAAPLLCARSPGRRSWREPSPSLACHGAHRILVRTALTPWYTGDDTRPASSSTSRSNETVLEQRKADAGQSLYVVENTVHRVGFPFVKMSRWMHTHSTLPLAHLQGAGDMGRLPQRSSLANRYSK